MNKIQFSRPSSPYTPDTGDIPAAASPDAGASSPASSMRDGAPARTLWDTLPAWQKTHGAPHEVAQQLAASRWDKATFEEAGEPGNWTALPPEEQALALLYVSLRDAVDLSRPPEKAGEVAVGRANAAFETFVQWHALARHGDAPTAAQFEALPAPLREDCARYSGLLARLEGDAALPADYAQTRALAADGDFTGQSPASVAVSDEMYHDLTQSVETAAQAWTQARETTRRARAHDADFGTPRQWLTGLREAAGTAWRDDGKGFWGWGAGHEDVQPEVRPEVPPEVPAWQPQSSQIKLLFDLLQPAASRLGSAVARRVEAQLLDALKPTDVAVWGGGDDQVQKQLDKADRAARRELAHTNKPLYDELHGEKSRGGAFHSNVRVERVGAVGDDEATIERIEDDGHRVREPEPRSGREPRPTERAHAPTERPSIAPDPVERSVGSGSLAPRPPIGPGVVSAVLSAKDALSHALWGAPETTTPPQAPLARERRSVEVGGARIGLDPLDRSTLIGPSAEAWGALSPREKIELALLGHYMQWAGREAIGQRIVQGMMRQLDTLSGIVQAHAGSNAEADQAIEQYLGGLLKLDRDRLGVAAQVGEYLESHPDASFHDMVEESETVRVHGRGMQVADAYQVVARHKGQISPVITQNPLEAQPKAPVMPLHLPDRMHYVTDHPDTYRKLSYGDQLELAWFSRYTKLGNDEPTAAVLAGETKKTLHGIDAKSTPISAVTKYLGELDAGTRHSLGVSFQIFWHLYAAPDSTLSELVAKLDEVDRAGSHPINPGELLFAQSMATWQETSPLDKAQCAFALFGEDIGKLSRKLNYDHAKATKLVTQAYPYAFNAALGPATDRGDVLTYLERINHATKLLAQNPSIPLKALTEAVTKNYFDGQKNSTDSPDASQVYSDFYFANVLQATTDFNFDKEDGGKVAPSVILQAVFAAYGKPVPLSLGDVTTLDASSMRREWFIELGGLRGDDAYLRDISAAIYLAQQGSLIPPGQDVAQTGNMRDYLFSHATKALLAGLVAEAAESKGKNTKAPTSTSQTPAAGINGTNAVVALDAIATVLGVSNHHPNELVSRLVDAETGWHTQKTLVRPLADACARYAQAASIRLTGRNLKEIVDHGLTQLSQQLLNWQGANAPTLETMQPFVDAGMRLLDDCDYLGVRAIFGNAKMAPEGFRVLADTMTDPEFADANLPPGTYETVKRIRELVRVYSFSPSALTHFPGVTFDRNPFGVLQQKDIDVPPHLRDHASQVRKGHKVDWNNNNLVVLEQQDRIVAIGRTPVAKDGTFQFVQQPWRPYPGQVEPAIIVKETDHLNGEILQTPRYSIELDDDLQSSGPDATTWKTLTTREKAEAALIDALMATDHLTRAQVQHFIQQQPAFDVHAASRFLGTRIPVPFSDAIYGRTLHEHPEIKTVLPHLKAFIDSRDNVSREQVKQKATRLVEQYRADPGFIKQLDNFGLPYFYHLIDASRHYDLAMHEHGAPVSFFSTIQKVFEQAEVPLDDQTIAAFGQEHWDGTTLKPAEKYLFDTAWNIYRRQTDNDYVKKITADNKLPAKPFDEVVRQAAIAHIRHEQEGKCISEVFRNPADDQSPLMMYFDGFCLRNAQGKGIDELCTCKEFNRIPLVKDSSETRKRDLMARALEHKGLSPEFIHGTGPAAMDTAVRQSLALRGTPLAPGFRFGSVSNLYQRFTQLCDEWPQDSNDMHPAVRFIRSWEGARGVHDNYANWASQPGAFDARVKAERLWGQVSDYIKNHPDDASAAVLREKLRPLQETLKTARAYEIVTTPAGKEKYFEVPTLAGFSGNLEFDEVQAAHDILGRHGYTHEEIVTPRQYRVTVHSPGMLAKKTRVVSPLQFFLEKAQNWRTSSSLMKVPGKKTINAYDELDKAMDDYKKKLTRGNPHLRATAAENLQLAGTPPTAVNIDTEVDKLIQKLQIRTLRERFWQDVRDGAEHVVSVVPYVGPAYNMVVGGIQGDKGRFLEAMGWLFSDVVGTTPARLLKAGGKLVVSMTTGASVVNRILSLGKVGHFSNAARSIEIARLFSSTPIKRLPKELLKHFKDGVLPRHDIPPLIQAEIIAWLRGGKTPGDSVNTAWWLISRLAQIPEKDAQAQIAGHKGTEPANLHKIAEAITELIAMRDAYNILVQNDTAPTVSVAGQTQKVMARQTVVEGMSWLEQLGTPDLSERTTDQWLPKVFNITAAPAEAAAVKQHIQTLYTNVPEFKAMCHQHADSGGAPWQVRVDQGGGAVDFDNNVIPVSTQGDRFQHYPGPGGETVTQTVDEARSWEWNFQLFSALTNPSRPEDDSPVIHRGLPVYLADKAAGNAKPHIASAGLTDQPLDSKLAAELTIAAPQEDAILDEMFGQFFPSRSSIQAPDPARENTKLGREIRDYFNSVPSRQADTATFTARLDTLLDKQKIQVEGLSAADFSQLCESYYKASQEFRNAFHIWEARAATEPPIEDTLVLNPPDTQSLTENGVRPTDVNRIVAKLLNVMVGQRHGLPAEQAKQRLSLGDFLFNRIIDETGMDLPKLVISAHLTPDEAHKLAASATRLRRKLAHNEETFQFIRESNAKTAYQGVKTMWIAADQLGKHLAGKTAVDKLPWPFSEPGKPAASLTSDTPEAWRPLIDPGVLAHPPDVKNTTSFQVLT